MKWEKKEQTQVEGKPVKLWAAVVGNKGQNPEPTPHSSAWASSSGLRGSVQSPASWQKYRPLNSFYFEYVFIDF